MVSTAQGLPTHLITGQTVAITTLNHGGCQILATHTHTGMGMINLEGKRRHIWHALTIISERREGEKEGERMRKYMYKGREPFSSFQATIW